MELIYEKLLTLPTTNKDARMYVRMLTAKASECSFDSQGRILIPLKLREFAELKGDVCFIGMSDFFEVWCPENWIREDSECSEESMDAIAEEFNL